MAKTTIDDELAKFLKQAKSRPRNFALLASGTNCTQLLVDKKKITAAAIAAAKKETNAKKAYQGVCEGDGGTSMVFKVLEEPSVSIVKLKTFIAENAGLPLKPRFEIVEEIIEVDEIGDGPISPEIPAAPPAPQVDPAKKQQFRNALVKVVPAVQRTLKSPDTPEPAKNELRGLVGQLKSDVAENRFDDAKAVIGQIVPLVKKFAPAPATQQASPDQAASSESTKRPLPQKVIAEWRLKWTQAKSQAHSHLTALYGSFADRLDEEDAAALEQGVGAKFDEVRRHLDTELESAFDDLLNAELPQQAAAYQNVAAIAVNLQKFVNDNELIQTLDEYPFPEANPEIGKQLSAVLAEIAAPA